MILTILKYWDPQVIEVTSVHIRIKDLSQRLDDIRRYL